ncbi:sensor histidine kinase [uncultured Enterococcus sp.]|uniref:sensor histidine kinase n=1 Tax=uncultured Enterococcus sp. TaxID=167972 RepID=UPI0025E7A013|nr:sensor histidine kinase [uncultured Enterococcus sp.]
MFALVLPLLERVGLIILLANLLMNSPYYKKLMYHRQERLAQIVLILTFSIFAIISNFTGVLVTDARQIDSSAFVNLASHASIANTRTLTIGMSGLIGGPVVGLFVGLISGTVRFMQGGTAPYTYFISSIVIGCASGIFGYFSLKKQTYPSIVQGAVCGVLMEVIQMMCIFLFLPDRTQAILLIETIALPMIFVNALGTSLFLSIILSTLKQEESTRAIQTHDVLELANTTLPYFRQGLTAESAYQTAEQIKKFMRVSAVSVTNQTEILAHVGEASDHHIAKEAIITDLSKEVLKTGELHVVRTKREIGCSHPDCPLEAAIVVPLMVQAKVIGTFKLYFTDASELTYVEEQLAKGLGEIFSSQIELGEMDNAQRLLKDAEIKSLQAQVNPHFLFNAINTISALMRFDSEQARHLLLQLGHYFRANLNGHRNNLIPVSEELAHVEAYLAIEQARFPERYTINFAIDPVLHTIQIPPFVIQILVENALKHAFIGRKRGNQVFVTAQKNETTVTISVKDNGQGIDPVKQARLGREVVESKSGTGSALENINRRLVSLFGQEAHLVIESTPDGSCFSFTIPVLEKE